ncbi:MAG: glucokinase [Pseudomonadota bacterium]
MNTILADIGGTHVRFAIAGDDAISHPQKLKSAEHDGFLAALEHYLSDVKMSADTIIAASAAWPNEHGVYTFSNHSGWDFDPQALRSEGYKVWPVFNDFEAASYGALSLPDDKIKTLKSGRSGRDYPRVICGPGTGCGLAYALPEGDNHWRVQATFGAHMLPACFSQDQYAIAMEASKLSTERDILKFEHLCSGRGFPLLHKAVCNVLELKPVNGKTRDILEHHNEQSVQASLDFFHEFLGLFINSSVITTHGYGGVYLNGGMLDRLMEKNLFDFDRVKQSMMVPLIDYVDHVMADVPVFYVSDPYLALHGLMEIYKHGESLSHD